MDEHVTPEVAREVIGRWMLQRNPANVRLVENIDPAVDDAADYVISYQAVFEPIIPDAARLELWVTSAGDIAVGLERWDRVANRIHAAQGSQRFAGGHDPIRISTVALTAILNLIADAQVALKPIVLPVIGLVGTTSVTERGTRERLARLGYSYPGWLNEVPRDVFLGKPGLVRFAPW